jgi:hypothetical protein
LADEDPDVDAIYRLVVGKACIFRERAPVVLAKGTLCPWNSQNTAVRRELFPLLYLPVTVTFRFTDILRSLVAQPIMAAAGYGLGFLGATVVQKRNPHDPMADSENLLAAYESLAAAGIVERAELETLRAWLEGLRQAMGPPQRIG